AADVDLARISAPGARLLPSVLSWAQDQGRMPPSAQGAEEPVADQVLADFIGRLRARGVDVRVARGETAIDLELHRRGVRLAVGWDGVEYAGRRDTRDRDRLHREQLERRGWRFLQLWSTDVFRDPERELDRVMMEFTPPGEPGIEAAGEFAVSADDRDLGWGEAADRDHDAWLREQRPPHWG
ncbi:MAG: hypothetical protein ACRC0L_09180, partial [Angustibacter sp.]